MFAIHAEPDLLPHAQRSLSRVDLYRPIHKALRLYMSQLLHRVGALDHEDPEELDDTLMRTQRMLNQFAAHLAHENAFLHPAIQGATGAADLRTARDHDDHCRAIAALRDRVLTLRTCPAQDRAAVALCLYRELALFVADNLQHMQTEEAENNAALWRKLDDAALHALHARLLAHVAPEILEDALPWFVRALNPRELAELFSGMRATAPAPAFRAALELARATLDDTRFSKLARALELHPQALAA